MSCAGSYWANRPIIMDIIRRRKPASILDIGVGTGYYGEMIRRDLPDVKLHGFEPFVEYYNDRWKCYDLIHNLDVRTAELGLDGFDLYLMIDVIEHMSKEEGMALLERLPGPVLVSTPWHYEQGPDENPLQAHVSEWTLADFAGFPYEDHSNYLSAIVVVRG